MKYICYTDGSSRGNPGAGGWGCIIMSETTVTEHNGRADVATNNQMEMQGLIHALKFAISCGDNDEVEIHSDSQYCVKGYNEWLAGWQRNNWKNSQKKPVLNKDLWQEIVDLKNTIIEKGIKMKVVHVYGHSGHIYNERADILCTSAALKEPVELFNGSINDYKQHISA